MSWLARSIANSLRLDEEDDDAAEEEKKKALDDAVPRHIPDGAVLRENRPPETALSAEDRRFGDCDGDSRCNRDGDEQLDDDTEQGRGVREDLSEFKESLTRQFWGVASFLAPPPPPPPPPPLSQRLDFLRVQSKSEVTVSGNVEEEEEEEELVEYDEREPDQFGEFANSSQQNDYYTNIIEDAIGITEEVLAFARNIAHHPETWLDFPLSEEEEFDDFDISDAQYKHVIAIEHLAPRLAALRFELCPVHMSEGYFWMVYFVLLHSRLNKHDAGLLSSPQLAQARAVWMQELQKRTKGDSYWSGVSTFFSKESTDSPRENSTTHSYEDTRFGHESEWVPPSQSSTQVTADQEIEKLPLDEIEFVDKSVIKEDPPPELQDKEIVVGSSVKMPVDDDDDDDDDDDWLKDDSDLIGYTGPSFVVNEDDISFSDLEDDLDSTIPTKLKTSSTGRNTTTETA